MGQGHQWLISTPRPLRSADGGYRQRCRGRRRLLLISEREPDRGVCVYLPISDGLGNVCALVDAADGSLAAEYDYDPYGNPVIGRGPAMDACPFRHRTRYYDAETWLYYYGYRYYDPSVTKWISKDPLGEEGGWNLTCFCGNDPVNQYDALGLVGEGFVYDGLADFFESRASETDSPTWAYWWSSAESSMRFSAGLDPVFTSTQQARHMFDVYDSFGAGEGTKILAKEASWELAEITPYPEILKFNDPNSDMWEKTGAAIVGGCKTAGLVIGGVAVLRGGGYTPAIGEVGSRAIKNTPRLFHYTDSAGGGGIRGANKTLVPGKASGGKVWATTITPEQMFGSYGWFYRLGIGGGWNFERVGQLGIRYTGTTKFTRYFEIVTPDEFTRAWVPEPYKGMMGQFFKEGNSTVK